MANIAALDAQMTKLMNLRQEWIANDYSNAAADRLREETCKTFPSSLWG